MVDGFSSDIYTVVSFSPNLYAYMMHCCRTLFRSIIVNLNHDNLAADLIIGFSSYKPLYGYFGHEIYFIFSGIYHMNFCTVLKTIELNNQHIYSTILHNQKYLDQV